MIVKNHTLFTNDGNQIDFVDTPNKSGTISPLYLIMHYTAGTSFSGAVNWLANKQAKASAHIVIGRDGKVVQMVSFNRRAWHAGKSNWGELSSLNKYSIGIELVNAGRLQQRADGAWVTWTKKVISDEDVVLLTHKNETQETGWHNYTEEQINSAIEVASALHEKYQFSDVLGHEDIAPIRKSDPGPAFPLSSFSSIVMGRFEG